MGGSSKKVTVGYKYYLGMHMILCHGPADKLLNITVDGRRAWSGVSTGGRINVQAADLFGGESREGGVSGAVDLEMGLPTQGRNDYLQSQLGSDIPAYRGVVGAVLRQCYLGLNPYLKKWAFRLSRIHKRTGGLDQWYDEKASIGEGEAETVFSETFSAGNLNAYENYQHPNQSHIGIPNGKDYFRIVQDDFGPCIEIMRPDPGEHPVISTGVSFTGRLQSIKFKFKNVERGGDDNGSLVIRDAGDNPVFSFSVARDSFFEPLQRPTVAFSDQIGVVGVPIGSGPVEVGVWYEAAITYDSNSGQFDCTVKRLDTGEVHGSISVSVTGRGVPTKVQFENDDGSDSAGLVAGISRFDDVTVTVAVEYDMNPAHIIRECLTDPDWGMGYSDADVDDQSFMAAADKLYDERMGISILWDRQTTIEDFIGEILRHIDAALYVDRKTGKFTLKLIRGGYNKDNLLHLNEDNIEKIENFTRPAFGELTNSVTVNYWDRSTGKDASVTAQDIALQQMQGVTIGTTIQYPGFTNPALASRVAQRDLKSLSSQRASCTIYADRTAKDLTIGDVFKLSWADYNLSEVVMRVTGIAYGDGRTNRIKITCVEDVFDLPETVLVTPQPPQWENPSQAPRPITRQIAFEAPYLELVQRYGQDVVDARLAENPDAGYVGAAGVSPGGAAINARVYTNNGSGYEDIGVLDFCPGASLAVAVDQLEETFILDQGSNLDLVNVGTWGQIDEELFAVVSINGNTMTVKRGVLDTVVRPHAAGTPIIFWDEFSTVDDTEYVTSEQVAVKLATVSGSGELPLEQAPEMSVTMRGRANRPYPPGNFKVNGQYFPSEVNWEEPVFLSWAHRDRLQQTGASLIDFTASDIGPEPGVSYVVRLTAIFPEDPPLKIYEEGGILGNTHTIDPELVTIPPEAVSILLEVASERDGLESMWAQSHEVWILQAPYNLKAVWTEE